MNRLLVLVIGALGIGVVAMIVVLMFGGGRDVPTIAGTQLGQTDETGDAVTTPADAETDAASLALFDAWADPLRAAGFAIDAGNVTSDGDTLVVSNFGMTAPADTLAWRLTAQRVRIDTRDDGGAAITPDGAMVLGLPDDSNPSSWPMTAESVDFAVERSDDGTLSSYTATLANISIGDDTTSEPILAAEASMRAGLGADATDSAGDATLHFSDLVLPTQGGGPLGTTIHAFDAVFASEGGRSGFAAPWRGEGAALTLNSIALDWGSLHFTGSGTLAIDGAGRPAGTLQVNIENILSVLDAFNAVLHFDTGVVADTYAALLLELGDAPASETLPFTIDITDGQIILRGQSHGIADIVLGTVSVIYRPLIIE